MEENCAICLEPLISGGSEQRRCVLQTLACEHVFHERCVADLRRHGRAPRCPLCRAASSELTTVQEMLDSAVLRDTEGDHAGAAVLYQQILGVDASHVQALLNLALCYDRGQGVRRSKGKAFELFRRAHAAGSADAIYRLGMKYDNGDGVERNVEKAFRLYREAHAAGHAEATCNLALMYIMGDAVEQDMSEGQDLLEQAHEAGHAVAANALRLMTPPRALPCFSDPHSMTALSLLQ
jgi:TPR repeat protein